MNIAKLPIYIGTTLIGLAIVSPLWFFIEEEPLLIIPVVLAIIIHITIRHFKMPISDTILLDSTSITILSFLGGLFFCSNVDCSFGIVPILLLAPLSLALIAAYVIHRIIVAKSKKTNT